MNATELGRKGEQMAIDHLITNNYSILDRNFRWRHAEIDIACQAGNTLVIVEVKTRQTNIFGEPYDAVSRSKQRQIIRVANHYLKEKKLDFEVRFDVISIVTNKYETKLEHIENAFYPLL